MSTVPVGYRVLRKGLTRAVLRESHYDALFEMLEEGSFYDYAAHSVLSRVLHGRSVAYAVPLPQDELCVVVRRSTHGGLLAPLTRDLFLTPTRAPRELRTSLRLDRLGIPTPEVLAIATYIAGPLLRRADVVTREIANGQDLDEALRDAPNANARREMLEAAGRLLAAMAEAGVRHPDLNLKNILVAPDENEDQQAWVLDVDRVWFEDPSAGRAADANMRRLARSARKRRRSHGTPVDDSDLARLAEASGASFGEHTR